MNEITRIRLGRTAYDIDINAKKELERYGQAVRRSLGDDSDVYDDIEIRMTEILSDLGVNPGGVITLGEVEAIEAQLGQPEDFADDSQPKPADDGDDNPFNDPVVKPAKHYYRDIDNALAGGVLSGLAAYTGIDVTILRLIFVGLCFLSFGTFFFVYIIMWIITPAAVTVGEKLEMRGEPVDLNTIKQTAKNFGDEATRAGNNLKERVQGLKVADNTSRPTTGRRVVRAAAACAGALLLMTTVCCLIAGLFAGALAIVSTIGVSGGGTMLAVIIMGLIGGIALAACLIAVSSALINFRLGRRTASTILTSLAIGMAMLISAPIVSIAWIGLNDSDHVYTVTSDIVNNAHQRFGL